MKPATCVSVKNRGGDLMDLAYYWCCHPECKRVCVEGGTDWHEDLVIHSEIFTGRVGSLISICPEHRVKKAA